MVQELYCHGCDKYVQFEIDKSLDGNHEIKCPDCGHIHYRFIENGRITDIRFRSSSQTYYATAIRWNQYSINTTSASGSTWLASSWASTSTATGGY